MYVRYLALLTWPIASVSAKRTSITFRWRNSPGRSRRSSGTGTRGSASPSARPAACTPSGMQARGFGVRGLPRACRRSRRCPDARAMACRLGAIATRGHIAPPPPAGGRVVVEGPATVVVGADPQPARVFFADDPCESLRQAGERIVDRIADVAVVQPRAGVVCDELDHFAVTQDAVQLRERFATDPSLLDGRVEQLAHGVPAAADLFGRTSFIDRAVVGIPGPVGQAAFGQPVDTSSDLADLVVRAGSMFVAFEMERVDEVEGVVQRRLVAMDGSHVVTTLAPLTGYWQGAIIQ